MRKDRFLRMLAAVVAALVVGLAALAAPRTALAADHSDYLTITDLWILDREGVRIDLDKGDDPAAYSNGLADGEPCGWGFSWRLDLDGGHRLQAGDTAKLRLGWPDAGRHNFAPSPLLDEAGDQIGTWEIVSDVVTLTFDEGVEGKTSLEREAARRRSSTGGGARIPAIRFGPSRSRGRATARAQYRGPTSPRRQSSRL